ncbi:MAG: hypothetical protein ABL999_11265 [Pyrinomonadaceae bacterium]
MKNKKHITLSMGVILLTVVIGVSLPQTGHSALAAPDKDVRVINTPTEAVPVNVIGTPTVNASQQGVWNVGLVGTPPVRVTNGETNPVVIRDANYQAQQPYQAAVDLVIGPGQGGENAEIPVAPGKLFVIEHVSAFSSTDQTLDTFALLTHIAPDNTLRTHYLNNDRRQLTTGGIYTVSESLKLYADAPGVVVRATRLGSTDSVTVRYTVSGYLIDK